MPPPAHTNPKQKVTVVQTGEMDSYNLFAYCENNPIMGYDPAGTFDIWSFMKGAGRIVTGITAVAAGAAVCIAGAPVAVIVAAAVAITAGVLTTVNGSADIQQSFAGENFVRDMVFSVNQNAYDVYSGVMETTAIVGSIACGIYTRPNAENLKMSQTVQNHINDIVQKGPNAGELSRPYIDSACTTLLMQEIMKAVIPVSDAILQSGLRWDVAGSFRGSMGTWELVVDMATNTVVHFNFITK